MPVSRDLAKRISALEAAAANRPASPFISLSATQLARYREWQDQVRDYAEAHGCMAYAVILDDLIEMPLDIEKALYGQSRHIDDGAEN